MTFLGVLIIYYIIINIIAFCVMGIDKRKAVKEKWRIKENTLFILALIGGFIGYYAGMHFFHHKTKKTIFHICFYVSLAIHLFLMYLLFIR